MFISCIGKRHDHSGCHRQSPTFVPTKSLQNSCFIDRAWPSLKAVYTVQHFEKKKPKMFLRYRCCAANLQNIRSMPFYCRPLTTLRPWKPGVVHIPSPSSQFLWLFAICNDPIFLAGPGKSSGWPGRNSSLTFRTTTVINYFKFV